MLRLRRRASARRSRACARPPAAACPGGRSRCSSTWRSVSARKARFQRSPSAPASAPMRERARIPQRIEQARPPAELANALARSRRDGLPPRAPPARAVARRASRAGERLRPDRAPARTPRRRGSRASAPPRARARARRAPLRAASRRATRARHCHPSDGAQRAVELSNESIDVHGFGGSVRS